MDSSPNSPLLFSPTFLRTKSVLEETGNYVLNSILVDLLLLGSFRLVLGIVRSPAPSTLGAAMAQKQLASWARQHRYLIVFYYIASLLLSSVFGAIRGISERDRRIGTWLADNRWLSPLLVRFGVLAFLEEAPVWYEALRQKTRNERTFVEVKMKEEAGFYTANSRATGSSPIQSGTKNSCSLTQPIRKPRKALMSPWMWTAFCSILPTRNLWQSSRRKACECIRASHLGEWKD